MGFIKVRRLKTQTQWAYHFLLGVLGIKIKIVCEVQTRVHMRTSAHPCVPVQRPGEDVECPAISVSLFPLETRVFEPEALFPVRLET